MRDEGGPSPAEPVGPGAGTAARELFLAGLERALQPLDDPAEIMATGARLVGERLACDRCAYAEAEADQDHFTMTGSYARGLPPLTGRMAMSDFSAETLRCMRAGEPYVVADAFSDTRVLPDQREIYRRTGITAVVCVPLRKVGRFVAAMAVHHTTPRVWTDAEIELLLTVVNRCWESLQRVHAMNALRENEERYRLLVERASDGIWLADADGRYLDVNPAACTLLGYTRAEHLRLTVADLVSPADRERLPALLAELSTGRALTQVWELRRSDGTFVPVELSMRSAGAGRLQSVGRDITARRRAEAERERLLERERAANRHLRLLQDATAALSAAATPAQVGSIAIAQLRQLLDVESVAAWELRDGALHALEAENWPEGTHRWRRVPLDADNPVTEAVRTGAPVWLADDAEWGERYPGQRRTLEQHGYSGMAALPLTAAGRCLGVAIATFTAARAPGDGERVTAVTLTDQCAQALDRARLYQAEHEVADVLQRSLLPARLPLLTRLAGAARYTPAAEHALSGGDWYDMVQVGETTVAFVVGDVVGHGPAAAAVMGQLRSVLAAQLLDGCGPAQALDRLDRFAARVAGSAGSTCACLLHDWSTGTLRWTLAGHPPVLLVDGDGARFLGAGPGEGTGAVLGVRGRAPYREGSTVLPPGSSVVLYTDGLVERRGELLDTGLRRLESAAAGLAGLGPSELVGALVDAVLDEAGPADDVALLVVRAVPAPLSGRLPAAGTSMRVLRQAVGAWAEAAGLPLDLTEDLELALGEAAANAAEHAYTGSSLPAVERDFAYTVAREATGDVEVGVQDRGRWRPVPDDNGYRGHGLRVIGELTDDLEIDRTDGGTHIRFRLPAPPAAAPSRRLRPTGVRRLEVAPAAVRELPGRRFAVSGDVDLAGRDAVAPVLLGAASAAAPITVDLTGVRYLSSAGVALLAEVAALAGDALTVVVAAGSAPARICALTGIADALPVVLEDVPAPVGP